MDGLLLLDKPQGPTSHDLVARVRKGLGVRRVGHGGTLDPMATGLMPIVVGRATRLVRFLPTSPKVYEGRIRLGETTDSDDVTGEVLLRHDGPLPSSDAVLDAARTFLGRQLQRPPSVSARKIEGKRMYRMAREGAPVEAPPTEVLITRLDLEPTERPDEYGFVAEVSGGTYIRAIARDLGSRLDCGGTLASLRRTAIGPMNVLDALAVGADERPARDRLIDALIPLEKMPLGIPASRLSDPAEARRFALGGPVPPGGEVPVDGLCCVVAPTGELLGIGEHDGALLHPRVVVADRPDS
jgi:tRNA pseudouridine55 synthase